MVKRKTILAQAVMLHADRNTSKVIRNVFII
mgnify:CR=1 FL=1